jgi:hypothetical protein
MTRPGLPFLVSRPVEMAVPGDSRVPWLGAHSILQNGEISESGFTDGPQGWSGHDAFPHSSMSFGSLGRAQSLGFVEMSATTDASAT